MSGPNTANPYFNRVMGSEFAQKVPTRLYDLRAELPEFCVPDHVLDLARRGASVALPVLFERGPPELGEASLGAETLPRQITFEFGATFLYSYFSFPPSACSPQLCENKNEHQKSGLFKVAHTSQEQNDTKKILYLKNCRSRKNGENKM